MIAKVRVAVFLAIALVEATGSLAGQTGAVKDACDQVTKIAVPRQDWPTLAQAYSADVPIKRDGDPGARTCSPADLYYGSGAGHFEKARYCALAQGGMIRGTSDKGQIEAAQDAATGGATRPDADALADISGWVLAMVYANGEGVAQNLPLARAYVCEYGGGIAGDAPSDLLKGFDETIRRHQRFDVCYGAAGDFGRSVDYQCLGLRMDKQEQEIRAREHSILRTASPQLRVQFGRLRAAWAAYRSAYSEMVSEQCAGGTGCGVISESGDVTITDTWLAALKQLEAGKAPAATADPSSFKQIDRELNATYRHELDGFPSTATDDCCREQIRSADLAWLDYREAWVKFGAVRWPEVPADQWRVWQTVEWMSLLTAND